MVVGRPSKLDKWRTEDGLKKLAHYKRNDMTDAEIARSKIGINPCTLSVWRSKYPEIDNALKKGFEDCISDAEEALISKFKPYIYEEEVTETWAEVDPETNKVKQPDKVHKKIVKKVALPDTAAIIFFLKAKAGWSENTEQTDTEALTRLDAILAERRKNAFKPEAE